jgi:phosphonate degradation associated HDIG domain protein
LFARFGSKQYGEDVSLERHMLQSAVAAQKLGASDAVVVAALLHDIGYFVYPESETSIEEGRNTEHEALGAAWLSQSFGEDITAPVALHVEAKRYLCAVEPGYFDRLSDASRASLMVQGGIMNAREVAAFAKQPGFEAAIILRRADDVGKDIALETPPLEHFRGLLTAALRKP